MLYPRPDRFHIESWQSTVELLVDSTEAEKSLLRVAYPTTTEIVAAAPGTNGLFTIGHREHRNTHQYSEATLQSRRTVTIRDADTDARWDGCSERRSGYRHGRGGPDPAKHPPDCPGQCRGSVARL